MDTLKKGSWYGSRNSFLSLSEIVADREYNITDMPELAINAQDMIWALSNQKSLYTPGDMYICADGNGTAYLYGHVYQFTNDSTSPNGVKWVDVTNTVMNTYTSKFAPIVNGTIPAQYLPELPSFVDDVIEGRYSPADPMESGRSYFYTDADPNNMIECEAGKIYVDKETNITYRWSGTHLVEISSSLALGETSSTAFPGDKGANLYAGYYGDGSAEKFSYVPMKVEKANTAITANRADNIKDKNGSYVDFHSALTTSLGDFGRSFLNGEYVVDAFVSDNGVLHVDSANPEGEREEDIFGVNIPNLISTNANSVGKYIKDLWKNLSFKSNSILLFNDAMNYPADLGGLDSIIMRTGKLKDDNGEDLVCRSMYNSVIMGAEIAIESSPEYGGNTVLIGTCIKSVVNDDQRNPIAIGKELLVAYDDIMIGENCGSIKAYDSYGQRGDIVIGRDITLGEAAYDAIVIGGSHTYVEGSGIAIGDNLDINDASVVIGHDYIVNNSSALLSAGSMGVLDHVVGVIGEVWDITATNSAVVTAGMNAPYIHNSGVLTGSLGWSYFNSYNSAAVISSGNASCYLNNSAILKGGKVLNQIVMNDSVLISAESYNKSISLNNTYQLGLGNQANYTLNFFDHTIYKNAQLYENNAPISNTYATKSELSANYTTKAELTANYLTANQIANTYMQKGNFDGSNIVTKTELQANYLTSAQIAANYISKSSLDSTDIATKTELSANYVSKTQLQQANYATKAEVQAYFVGSSLNITGNTATLDMVSNCDYYCDTPLDSLTINSFTPADGNIRDEWEITFTTNTNTTISFVPNVRWAVATPVFENNRTYILSFMPGGTNSYLGIWTVIV